MATRSKRRKVGRSKSRIAARSRGVKTGLKPEIDLRLARSFVEFLNGKAGPAAFGWVTPELDRAARALGVTSNGNACVEQIKALPDEDRVRRGASAAMSWVAVRAGTSWRS